MHPCINEEAPAGRKSLCCHGNWATHVWGGVGGEEEGGGGEGVRGEQLVSASSEDCPHSGGVVHWNQCQGRHTGEDELQRTVLALLEWSVNCMYVCVRVYVHVYVCVRMCTPSVCVSVWMNAYVCVYLCLYIIFVCMCLCLCCISVFVLCVSSH